MFTKLLKHEFRSVKKILKPLTIAALLASSIGYLLMLIITKAPEANQNILLAIPNLLLMSGIFFFLICYFIGGIIYIYVHFYKTKFTNQGYLTFTLPVTTHQILLSSIINFLLWFLILILVVFTGVLLIFAPTFSSPQEVLYLMGIFYAAQNEITLGSILSAILSFLSTLCYAMVFPFLAITIGSLIAKKHKLIATLAVGYGINLGYDLIISIISTLTLRMQTFPDIYTATSAYILVENIVTIGISISGYFIMHHIIENKLNI